MIIHNKTSKKHAGAPRSSLRRGIQIALTSGLLVSGFAGAALRDHGPLNGTNYFPDWYRDADGMALGQCIVDDDAGNGPLCLLAGADPAGFAGNFGEEGFYATADVVIPVTGGNFHWMGHLEMAYMTPNGAPPAVRDPAKPQEVVFSRERIIFDVPAGCAGTYTVRTPFKVHEFDLAVGRRSLFFTDDILPVTGDFNAALNGHTGPFLQWDETLPAPPSVTAPNGQIRNYIGDPNIPHTFTGSTLDAGPGHLDKVKNNYVEVIPPAGCNLGAGVGVPLYEENASISGLKWDLPIADPVVINKTAFSRNGINANLNVWVSGPANKKLILTAATETSQSMPSMQLQEEVKDGPTGRYFGHLEFLIVPTNINKSRPAQVTVTNLDSAPVFNTTRAVVDAVFISEAQYDPLYTTLCVAARSGERDAANPAVLKVESLGLTLNTDFVLGVSKCGRAGDKVLEKNLSDFLPPDYRIPPEGIVVSSSKGGRESIQPAILRGKSDASIIDTEVSTTAASFAVDGTGNTVLDFVSKMKNPPAGGGQIVIISQPTMSKEVTVLNPDGSTKTVTITVTAGNIRGLANGTANFQAVEGVEGGDYTFFYAVQNPNDPKGYVSNVSKGTLNLTQVIPAPIAVADAQGVFRTSTGAVINVLANDVTGLTATPIDTASVQLEPLAGYTLGAGGKSLTGPRGTVTALADGTLRYVPTGQGGTANNTLFTVQYTVANTSGNGRRSAPVNVNIVLKSAAEAVAFQRVRFAGGWDVRFTSTYAGVAGTVTLAPAATCRLYRNTTAYANGTGTALGIIGTSLPGAGTNAFVVTGATPTTAGLGNTWVMGCVTSSGGRGSRTGTL